MSVRMCSEMWSVKGADQVCFYSVFTFFSPALLKQFQPHTDTINSIQLFNRTERLLILTASSDCAVALWDIEGRHIGIFGQVNYQCFGIYNQQVQNVYPHSSSEAGRRITQECRLESEWRGLVIWRSKFPTFTLKFGALSPCQPFGSPEGNVPSHCGCLAMPIKWAPVCNY